MPFEKALKKRSFAGGACAGKGAFGNKPPDKKKKEA